MLVSTNPLARGGSGAPPASAHGAPGLNDLRSYNQQRRAERISVHDPSRYMRPSGLSDRTRRRHFLKSTASLEFKSANGATAADVDGSLSLMLNMSRASNIQQLDESQPAAAASSLTHSNQNSHTPQQLRSPGYYSNSNNNSPQQLQQPSPSLSNSTSSSTAASSSNNNNAPQTLFKFHHLFLQSTARDQLRAIAQKGKKKGTKSLSVSVHGGGRKAADGTTKQQQQQHSGGLAPPALGGLGGLGIDDEEEEDFLI